MKKTTSFIAAMLTTVALAGAAQALTIPAGPVTFHWTDYEDSISGAGQTLQGVFTLDTITIGTSNTAIWAQGQGGLFLYGDFQGLTVQTYGGNSPTPTTFTGGTLNVYSMPGAFDLTKSATIYSDLANAGSLWLSAAFVPGANNFFPTATLVSSVSGSSGVSPNFVFNGSGSSYLDVTGGLEQAVFNTNGIAINGGGFADMSMVNTFSIYPTSTTNPLSLGWPVLSSDPIKATAAPVPEPGTLALLGAGMLGLIGLKRRKA